MTIPPFAHASLESWQRRLKELDGQRSSHEAVTPQLMWLQLVEQAADIARAVRSNRLERLRDGDLFAAPLLTLLRFAAAKEFDLADAAWAKFPAVCPYCIHLLPDFIDRARLPTPDLNTCRVLEPCSCPPPPKYTPFDPKAEWASAFRERADLRPQTVLQWQKLFSDLYAHRHRTNLDALAYHFIEEIGEVAYELRQDNPEALSFESADVLSWILSLASTAGRRLGESVDIESSMPTAYKRLTGSHRGVE